MIKLVESETDWNSYKHITNRNILTSLRVSHTIDNRRQIPFGVSSYLWCELFFVKEMTCQHIKFEQQNTHKPLECMYNAVRLNCYTPVMPAAP